MASVFLVWTGEYEQLGVDAAFSTREEADGYAAELTACGDATVEVTEQPVGRRDDKVAKAVWYAAVDVLTGVVRSQPVGEKISKYDAPLPPRRMVSPAERGGIHYGSLGFSPPTAAPRVHYSWSVVSQEDANEAAAEHRRAELERVGGLGRLAAAESRPGEEPAVVVYRKAAEGTP